MHSQNSLKEAIDNLEGLTENERAFLEKLTPEETAKLWEDVDAETFASLPNPKTGEIMTPDEARKLIDFAEQRGARIVAAENFARAKAKKKAKSKKKSQRKAKKLSRK